MEMLLLAGLFIAYRIATAIFAYYVTQSIPYLGFFPYRDELDPYRLPSALTSLANFDGIHYLQIAKNGYEQYTQAYFPLFPLLIKVLGKVFADNYLLAGIVLANAAFLGAVVVWKLYLDEAYRKPEMSFWTVLLLLAYPTSFFLGSVYTESLFMLLVISSLLALRRGNNLLAASLAALCSLTRLAGVFLLIPFICYIRIGKKKRWDWKDVATGVSPLIGFMIYAAYLWISTGDPLMFYHSQPAFGANRSTQIIMLPQVMFRYLRIFYTAVPNFQYLISVLEFVVFNAVLIVILFDLVLLLREKRRPSFALDVGLIGFSLANLLVPPHTGTFSSIPRYSVLSLSFFIAISRRVDNIYVKALLAILFFVLNLILEGLFMQGYFVS